jgi:hypothetical protein
MTPERDHSSSTHRRRRVARADVRTAARLRHADAIPNDHRRAAEPEHGDDADAGSNSIPAARHGVADREPDAHERPRDAVATGARSVLRGRRRAYTGA